MKLKTTLLFLSVFIIVTFLYSFVSRPATEDSSMNHGYNWEDFDPSYVHQYQDVQSVIDTADQHISPSQRNSLEYYNFIAAIIRKHFYHGFSHYSFAENPYASIAGFLVWDHLSAVVIPDDIMKHPRAACSQQALVMMEIFKRTGTDFRKVGLYNHFCVEAFIEGEWRFFDTNMEFKVGNQRESLSKMISAGRIDDAYRMAENNEKPVRQIFSNVKYGMVNEVPGTRAKFFHRFCYFLNSRTAFFVLLGMIMIYVTGINHRLYRLVQINC
jgi:hypothetical protein